MSDAKKCDRCGILYEIKYDKDRPSYNGQKVHRFSLISTNLSGDPTGEYDYDLCPNCACALMSWFIKPKEKEDISEEPDIRDAVHDMMHNLLG